MNKLFLTLVLVFSFNICFSQIDVFRIDLNNDSTNIKYNLCPDLTLNVQIYPKINRYGKYELINKKGVVLYTENYESADFVLINFAQRGVNVPNGKYKLNFISDEGEKVFINLYLKMRKNHTHSSAPIPELKK
jgi:hypothetical protein